MNRSKLVFLVVLAACGVDELDDTEQPVMQSHRPMGYARLDAMGRVLWSFNSTGGSVSSRRLATGRFDIAFLGLQSTSTGPGMRGNVQVSAEGRGPVRCKLDGWVSTARSTTVTVECAGIGGVLTDTPLAVMFMRDIWPTSPVGFAPHTAYSFVAANGVHDDRDDLTSSGMHNVTTREFTGRYTVMVPFAAATNATTLVTTASGSTPGLRTCSLLHWSPPTATIECRDTANRLADTAFSFLYVVGGGAPVNQQGAHAVFTGTTVDAARSAALGKRSSCSTATVTGSRSGSLATVTVRGELDARDGGFFNRAPLVTTLGAPGYCKVELMFEDNDPVDSNARAEVRCYDATGAVRPTPVFTFALLTSDVASPC